MTAPKKSTPVAVLKVPRLNNLLSTFAKSVLDAMTGNANFPDAVSLLLTLAEDIVAFDAGQTAALTRAAGTATARDGLRLAVIQDLDHLRDHVQKVIEKDMSAVEAAAAITSAGMRVRKASKRFKPELAVKKGRVSGQVLLVAKAVAHTAMYYWEYSLDQESWTPVTETMQASTTITGLMPAHVYAFRMYTRTRKGQNEYTQVVTLLVT